MKKTFNISKTFAIFSIVIFFLFALILCSDKSSNGIRTGLIFCSELLIPSLFPFMVLSSFVVKSGISSKISNVLSFATKFLFNLPGCTAATILIGLIGGYPVGARGIKSLLERDEITENQAIRMLYFTVGAGPAFIISVVGIGLLKSYQAGVILFVSQLISSFVLGIILRFNKETNEVKKVLISKKISFSNALVDSCTDSTISMLNMCSLVVLFCSILAVIKNTHIETNIAFFLKNIRINNGICKSFLPMIFEVTSACRDFVISKVPYQFFAFLLAWAGFCVHFQIYSIMGNLKFSKLKFTFFRFFHGIIAWGIASFLFHVFPVSVEASLTGKSINFNAYSFTSGSLALILLSACFLSTLTPKIIESKNKGESYEKTIREKH